MLRPLHYFLGLMIVALGLALAHVASAADTGPEAFYGRYQGRGIMQSPNSMYFGFTNRDLDVEIGAAEKGFFVEWTTVFRDVGEKHARRKMSRISFEPSGRSGIYIARNAAVDLSFGMSWATVIDGTLTVQVLTILDRGNYEMQTFERTLSKEGMFLYFRSDHDGQIIRIVTARLAKQTK
jgi:hypothetical protein